jgi:hypothetical protein
LYPWIKEERARYPTVIDHEADTADAD